MSVDWPAVYRSTYPDLVRFLHRKVWDPDRARDLAQEAFVRGLDREPDQPRAWLFRVASNLARDEARTGIRRKKHLTLLKAEAEVRQEAVEDPSERLEARERADRLRAALDTLTERDREALLLQEAGMGYPEIADHLGLKVGAVGTTLSRARKRLAEAWRAGEDTDVARG